MLVMLVPVMPVVQLKEAEKESRFHEIQGNSYS